MSRLIDGDKLLIEFMDSDLDHLQRDDWKEVIQIVQDAPTIQTYWIPVTERLPEESDDYLCSYGALTGHFVGIDIYDADKKEFGFYSDDEQGNEVWHHVKNVVAWMPLPAPYKED